MIAGTPHSPGAAFVAFAREFLTALADGDHGEALNRLDQTGPRWTKRDLAAALAAAAGGEPLCRPDAVAGRSARPRLDADAAGDVYLLRHRLPIAGRWADAAAAFEFRRKGRSGYFKVRLLGFE